MAISRLAQYVKDLMSPNPTGFDKRDDFNKNKYKRLGKFPVGGVADLDGDELKALLTFQKGEIAKQVLKTLTDADPNLTSGDVQNFWLWFFDFSRWTWPSGEDTKYDGDKPPPTILALYGGPQCQIHAVNAAKNAAGNVDLDIYVEGALPGCTIEVRDSGNTVVFTTNTAAPSATSTFRYSHFTVSTTVPLVTGSKYTVSVIDDLNGSKLIIFKDFNAP